MILPEELLDHEGYPTEELLEFISKYEPSDDFPLIKFIEVLESAWWMPDWGFKLHKKYKGKTKLELHTGGWSGNEEIMSAIESNLILGLYLRHTMWKRGGHYYYEFY